MIVSIRSSLPYDVYAGRGHCPRTGAPNIFGNPFSHLPSDIACVRVPSKAAAVAAFSEWLDGSKWQYVEPQRRTKILAALPGLRGKTWGCWCEKPPCHAEVLAKKSLDPSPKNV